jgi:DNA helicase-2/ATP-dependent DNA helicase PcrA
LIKKNRANKLQLKVDLHPVKIAENYFLVIAMNVNDKQKLCIEHVEGPLLVLAGAGSGKTRVVIERMNRLIQLGVPSSEIVAVTFTNKAAAEMAQRVKLSTDQSVLTCTFHSLCARILRESIHHIGYKNSFTIFDQQDAENCLKLCLKNRNIDEEKLSIKELKQTISSFKNDLLLPDDLVSLNIQGIKGPILDLYIDYQSKLKDFNALDFDDLLLLTVKLFENHSQVLDHYQTRWQFVLVDEYQDTNKAQYILIKLLVHQHKNIFAVGDPDQSIYSFRGANISNILHFEKDFPNAKMVTLDQNYRSTKRILASANALISWNKKRYEKSLFSDGELGEKIQIHYADNDHEESRWVFRNIEHLTVQKKIPYSSIAIFYRTNAQSRAYEDELLKWGIPYQIIGGISFYQRREIKDVLSFLRLLVQDNDFVSFERIINIPKRGIGPTALSNLLETSKRLNLSIIQICEKFLKGELAGDIKLSQKQSFGLYDFLQARKESLKMMGASLKELISSTIEQFKYLDYLKLDPETYEDRKANIQELLSKASEFEKEFPTKSLQEFLEEISLKGAQDEDSSNKDSIKLMTFHNSKGLEFPVVFMVGMEEDLFPHINCKEKEEDLEEERRLCYVGMTRAKKLLHLSCAKYRLLWGTPRIMQPSRFLSELPTDMIESNRNRKVAQTLEEVIDDSIFPSGTKVIHKSFGVGTVKKSYQGSLGLTYDVFFHELGELKTLVAKFAKLTKNI